MYDCIAAQHSLQVQLAVISPNYNLYQKLKLKLRFLLVFRVFLFRRNTSAFQHLQSFIKLFEFSRVRVMTSFRRRFAIGRIN